jgi:hypothetical protein
MSEDGASRRGVETGQAIKVYMQWAKGASTIVCAWTADGGCRGLIKKTFLRFPVRNYCCAQRKLQSSSLWVDGDETRARERRVGEGSRRKIAARRMQPASPSPSRRAEISDGPSRAEHGDVDQRTRCCPVQRKQEASPLDEAKKQAGGCVKLTVVDVSRSRFGTGQSPDQLAENPSTWAAKIPRRYHFKALSFVLFFCISV